MLIIPAGYVGEVVTGDQLDFGFNTINSSGTPVSTLTGAAGAGDPTIQYRDLTSGAVGNTGLTLTKNVQNGLHQVTLATALLTKNTDYQIEITVGEVGGVDVSNTILGSFTLDGKSAGRMYDQAVKCDSGSVTESTGSVRVVTITGVDIEDETADYYAAQVLKFGPGAANKNIGRTILKSVPGGAGTNKCTVTLQGSLPKPVVDNDPIVILPEERELTVYFANITVEFGLSTGTGDKYSVEWFANGEPMTDANTRITALTLQVVRWSSDAVVVNASYPGGELAWAPNAQLFKHTTPNGSGTPLNDGVTMKVTGTIDGITKMFSRTLFNYD